VYAGSLRDPAGSLDAWTALIAEEQLLLEEFPGKTSRNLVLDLLRWRAEFLLDLGRKSDAEQAMREAAALVQGAREQIIEMVDWLMAHEAWSLVDEIAARYADLFDKESLLMYRLAEAQLKRGQKDLAEKTAQRAFEVPNENMMERYEWAYRLHHGRGLIEWAEREYRHILEKEPLVSATAMRARQVLAEMLHDYERDQDAANVYKPLVEAMDQDPNVERGVIQARFDPGGIRSRMHYFFAEHARQQGDAATQRAELEKALQHDPEEADALIALYRAGQGDNAFGEQARRRVQTAADSFREQILQQRQYLDRAGANDVAREQGEFLLAMYDNQYAWLVANTFGDFQDALRASHESLKLRPNTGAYLDTLAHCYAALGDYENAVKYQTQAVEQDPHSAQIVRKLAFFEKQWEASKKKPSR
jgi:tetratricopeptide (TPR) repeat protein